MHERLVRTSSTSKDYDTKWGDYQPKQRLNVDQSLLPFATEYKKTYEIPEKDKKVWVNQPTSDTGKRFCSLNICFQPVGEQPRISVIFRG